MPGSPPRMRGKVRAISAFPSAIQDHPRVCGEKRSSLAHGRYRMGSPPRMRGKVLSGLATWLPIGITPAYAGKRPSRLRRDHERRDHPRVCGEKFWRFLSRLPDVGSPPRMRGKALATIGNIAGTGITPAYAGKRTGFGKSAFTKRDHPRVCGEKLPLRIRSPPPMGSPPRMRGKDMLM